MSAYYRALLVFCSPHKTYFVSRLVLSLFKPSLPPLVVGFYITLSPIVLNRQSFVEGRSPKPNPEAPRYNCDVEHYDRSVQLRTDEVTGDPRKHKRRSVIISILKLT